VAEGSHTVRGIRGGDSWGDISESGDVVRHCLLDRWGFGKLVPGPLMALDHVNGDRVHVSREN